MHNFSLLQFGEEILQPQFKSASAKFLTIITFLMAFLTTFEMLYDESLSFIVSILF